ncbi:MAG TPA: TAXI family TRAP transporter solute-binding subunit [Pseudonocardia sp.]|nr:TAXI family TRAP transporter solute-binding subunit [Pseudonocardia sp.]
MTGPSRRALLRAGLLAVPLVAACAPGAADAPLVLAAGEAGGFYVEFGELLAEELRRRGVPVAVAGTGGSVDNIRRVRDGRAALGLALSDIAVSARRGDAPFGVPVPLHAVGRVYENYMQLVVRAEDLATAVGHLAGRQVSLGAVGSGAAVFGDRLLAVAGVTAQVTRRPLRDAVAALETGRADALLWSGGVPTPALADLAARRPVRLLPLVEHLPELRARYGGVYGPVTVPAGAYGAAAPVPTVGVPNLLICTPDLPLETAGAVARTLVAAAPALVPESAAGTQYLDRRAIIGTGDVPLHAGAMVAYRDLHG